MKPLTARALALEVDVRARELMVALLPIVLGTVRLPFNTADRSNLDLISLIDLTFGIGDSSRDTSSNTTCGANASTNGSKSNVKRNCDQDSRAGLHRGSKGDGAEERLERNHFDNCKSFWRVIEKL